MIKSTFNWALDQLDSTGKEDSYEPHKHPVVLFNFVGQVQIIISDPNIVRDMFLTKNQLIDKTDMLRVMFQNFYGDSFLFSPTDKAWKEKRKATAHAFYKERTALMLNVLKDKVAALCQKWTTQI